MPNIKYTIHLTRMETAPERHGTPNKVMNALLSLMLEMLQISYSGQMHYSFIFIKPFYWLLQS